ncbi:MAG: histidine phosphatase family protein [bacterium]|nr:histidine phosphatase family protein [bacterium]
MVTLYLINQPESTWMKEERCEGQSDTSLTALGKAQSKKIANQLRQQTISSLYTSNLHRANQCARIIATIIPLKIKRDGRLGDINLGLWQGKFPEEIENRYPEVWANWKRDPLSAIIPDGEKLDEVVVRVDSFLKSLIDDELFDKNVIVITHDIIIRTILACLDGKSAVAIWDYTLDKASISEVQIQPEKRIIQFNKTDHLYVPSFT